MGRNGLRIRPFEAHSHFPSIANPPRTQIPPGNSKNQHFPKNRKILNPRTFPWYGPNGESLLRTQNGHGHVVRVCPGSVSGARQTKIVTKSFKIYKPMYCAARPFHSRSPLTDVSSSLSCLAPDRFTAASIRLDCNS